MNTLYECRKCDRSLPREAFSKDASREDEVSRYCKECTRLYRKRKPEGWVRKTADRAAYEREYRRANPEKFRVKERRKYERQMLKIHGPGWEPRKLLTDEEKRERRRALEQRKRDRAKQNPEKLKAMRARSYLRASVSRGKVQRLACFVCGAEAEAHHPTYDLPLAVTWLCAEHHREAHALTVELEKL